MNFQLKIKETILLYIKTTVPQAIKQRFIGEDKCVLVATYTLGRRLQFSVKLRQIALAYCGQTLLYCVLVFILLLVV